MYYINAFATAGDQTTIPTTGTEIGTVNFQYGYGSNYSASLESDPDALKVERLTFNYLMYTMTSNWQQLYQNGLPPFITTAMNGGSPFSYSANAVVLGQDGKNYFSIVGSNTSTPGSDPTKWQIWNPAPSTWEVTDTTSPVSTLANQTRVSNSGSLITIPLPSTQNSNDSFCVIGAGAGGWKISQAAGQKIYFGNLSTTTGTGGSLASTNQYDNVTLRYVTALSAWTVVASQGNITVV